MKVLFIAVITMLMTLFGSVSAQTITIGNGESSGQTIPYGMFRNYSTSQSIYTAAEMGGACTITSIAYNVASTGTEARSTSSVQIYMGHRSSSEFSSSSDYENVSNMTLVYSGSPTLASSTGWETFSLSIPFVYNGTSNLVVVVAKQASSINSASYYYTSTSSIQCLFRQSNYYSNYGVATNTSYSYSSSYSRANVRFGVKGFTQNGIVYGILGSDVIVGGTSQSSGALIIPDSVTNNGTTYYVTSIADSAFYGCTELTSIIIPSGVTSIGNSAFEHCYGLENFIIPSSVTSISNSTFKYCYGLGNITIPNSVTSIGSSAFRFCLSLTSITIPNSVTSIGSSAFSLCQKLTSISIPSSVTSIGNDAFWGCCRIKNVKFEDGTSTLSLGYQSNSYDSSNYYGLFRDCPIESLYLGRNLSYDTHSYQGFYCGYGSPFDYQKNLKNVTIGNSVNSIGSYAFYDCENLKKVFNNSSLSITAGSRDDGYVAYYAEAVYTNCYIDGDFVLSEDNGVKSICDYIGTSTEITIPNNVTSIGACAFHR